MHDQQTDTVEVLETTLWWKHIEDMIGNTKIIFMDNCGSFKYWPKDTSNKRYVLKKTHWMETCSHPDRRDISLPSRNNSTFNPTSSQPLTPPWQRNRSAYPASLLPPTTPPHPLPLKHESNSQLKLMRMILSCTLLDFWTGTQLNKKSDELTFKKQEISIQIEAYSRAKR